MRSWRPPSLCPLLIVILWTGSAVPAAPAPAQQAPAAGSAAAVDADQLLADLAALASPDMEGRRSGTDGNRRAREWILARLTGLGLQPVGGGFRQRFPLARGSDRADVFGVNVMALAPGTREPDRVVIMSAHYDHVGVRRGEIYPGADDNASGVAVLLAAAAWFARHPAPYSVLVVAFDAEEQGLLGARHFVEHPPVPLERVVALVNADMVARGDAGELVVAGTSHYPGLKPYVTAAARGARVRLVFGHDRPARDSGVEDWTHSSDHGPFHAAGVPFLYFGVRNHADYHKPTDTAERVPRAFFIEAAEIIVETVRRLAHPDTMTLHADVPAGP